MNSGQETSSPLRTLSVLRNSARAKEIVVVLLRNGFASLLGQIDRRQHSFLKKILPKSKKISLWQRIRETCEELGPTFVKFAQIIGTREDIIPAPLVSEFKRLRDRVAPCAWEDIEPVLIGELPRAFDEIFSEFDKTPVAAGSVGQVYKAKLKDGNCVAVKVRRPGAGKSMRADFQILEWIVQQAAERIPELASYDLPGILEEIRDGVMRETDFALEATNSQHFNSLNDDSEIFAPRVFRDLSSSRVMISEWVDGVRPGDPSISAETAKHLSIAGGKSIFRQIFKFGFFHADPHTGNVLISPDGRLCFLDWGCAGTLSREMRYFLADIFSAVSEMNAEKVLQIALCAIPPRERVEKEKLESEIAIILRRHADFATNSKAVGHIIFDMLRVFAKNNLPLPRDYALLAKSILVMEETGATLSPEFDLKTFAAQALRELYVERRMPQKIARGTIWAAARSMAYIRELPDSVQRILWKIESGDARAKIELEGLSATRQTLDRSANRVALALIISALLVASALLACASALSNGNLAFAKHLGISGFVVAAILSLWLFGTIVFGKRK